MRRAFAGMYVVLAIGLALLLLEGRGGTAAVPAIGDPAALAPGEYVWRPEIAPQGPIVAIVHLDEQRVYVYRNGIAIGLSTISSGRPGYETPTGVFTILERKREHYSNLYDNAPMPHMLRLTWGGVALHAGRLPGYPASHGCVRLPAAFAEKLFAATRRGDTVVVTSAASAGSVRSGLLAPVTAAGAPYPLPSHADGQASWDESAGNDGPVSVLVSLHDRAMFVLRNGVAVGSAPIEVGDGFSFQSSILFVVEQGMDERPSRLDPSRPRHRWTAFALSELPMPPVEELAAQLRIPDAFARRLYGLLAPGTTVLLTDLPTLVPSEAGAGGVQTVLESEPPPAEPPR